VPERSHAFTDHGKEVPVRPIYPFPGGL
jgi:hypothetical protein